MVHILLKNNNYEKRQRQSNHRVNLILELGKDYEFLLSEFNYLEISKSILQCYSSGYLISIILRM